MMTPNSAPFLGTLPSVTPSTPSYLRLYQEQRPGALSDDDLILWHDLSRSYEQLTGQSLEQLLAHNPTDLRSSDPTHSGPGIAPGHDTVALGFVESDEASSRSAARELAGGIRRLWDELLRTREALCRREAEVAAGVPLVEDRHEQAHLAERLEAVLNGGCRAVGCTAAALYTLDEATTQLSVRSVWNLPQSRFAQQPRLLREAQADLEALCGHAVVLNDTRQYLHWNPPETYAAAVCVPVSSSTTPLGTLWLYCDHPRDFSDDEVNMIEIVAGRLAADLEREMLLVVATDSTRLKHEVEAAERVQQNQMPRVSPPLDNWQVAGWTAQAKQLGGDFHDWFVTSDDRLLVALADCLDGGFDAALCASALQASLRAFSTTTPLPAPLLQRLSQSLWTGSAGDLYAHLFCGLIEPTSGRIVYASGGSLGAMLLSEGDWESLLKPSLALGIDPELKYSFQERFMLPGQTLVAVSDGVIEAPDVRGNPLGLASLAQTLLGRTKLSAEQMVDLVRDYLSTHSPVASREDRSVLVVKRRR